MKFEFLNQSYFGNTIGQWLLAMVIIIASVMVGKLVYWIFKNRMARLAAKSETDLDDLLVDLVEEPIVFCIIVGGIWYGIRRLAVPEVLGKWIDLGAHFILILAFTWLIARCIEALFSHYLMPLAQKSENELDDLLLPVIRKGTKIAVWSLGLIVALNNAGQDVGALIAGLGIGGLALAMAAKDTVANIFGGFTIFTDRPFSLKDRVKASGFDGTIEEIGIRSTRLRTLAGTLVTIPNSKFADSAVENVSAEPCRKVVLNLGLTYDTTPENMQKAMDLLRKLTADNTNLEEKVIVGFTEFGDFSLNLMLIYYIKKDSDIVQTQTDINMTILKSFNEANLEFAYPTQVILTNPS